jgi:hypothetical protein
LSNWDVPEGKAGQEGSSSLGGGNLKAPHHLLNPIPSGHRQIVQAAGPHGQRLGYSQDRLGLGEAAVALFEVKALADRLAKTYRPCRFPDQDRPRLGGDLTIGCGNPQWRRGSVYAHLGDASCVRGRFAFDSYILAAQEAFLTGFGPSTALTGGSQ